MAIKQTYVLNAEGKIVQKFYDSVTQEEGTSTTLELRKQIEDERGDVYDLASQALQWAGLLTSVVGVCYQFIPEEQKDLIPLEKRALIENTLALYAATETTTDVKLATKGFGFIQELLDNENKTAQILKDFS